MSIANGLMQPVCPLAPIELFSSDTLCYMTNSILDAVAKEDAGTRASASASGYRQGRRQSAADDDEDDRRYEGEGIVADDDEY